MTNYEARKEEIEKFLLENLLENGHATFGITRDGELVLCDGAICQNCNFYETDSCTKARKKWLNAEAESEEMKLAKSLNEGDIAEFSTDGEHWYLRYFKGICGLDGTYIAYTDASTGSYIWKHIRKPQFVKTNKRSKVRKDYDEF